MRNGTHNQVGRPDLRGNIGCPQITKRLSASIESLKIKLGVYDDYPIECGYAAVCLGYTTYHHLTNAGIKCVILAPTTMLT